jgi:hypothetical protein
VNGWAGGGEWEQLSLVTLPSTRSTMRSTIGTLPSARDCTHTALTICSPTLYSHSAHSTLCSLYPLLAPGR